MGYAAYDMQHTIAIHFYANKAFFICYEYEEITPILKGTWRYKQTKSGSFEEVSELTKSEEIRSLIETQERIRVFGSTV